MKLSMLVLDDPDELADIIFFQIFKECKNKLKTNVIKNRRFARLSGYFQRQRIDERFRLPQNITEDATNERWHEIKKGPPQKPFKVRFNTSLRFGFYPPARSYMKHHTSYMLITLLPSPSCYNLPVVSSEFQTARARIHENAF